MDIKPKYKNVIHTDATALARPRTGLEDMFLEVDPGTTRYPIAKPGWTMPVSNTRPEVHPDEVLSALDADTRAYLDLLINGAGQGLSKNGGKQLAGVFERFEPTHRDLARLDGAIAQRGVALQHLINSLQRLNTALAQKSAQIVSLIDASAKVFHAFASVNQSVSRAVADLPGTLRQTTITLNKVTTFAQLLGTATQDLIPAARALPGANISQANLGRAVAPPSPNTAAGQGPPGAVIQNEIRPFVIAARPLVQHLRPAAINLNQAQPSTTKDFAEFNRVFNMLGYNPGGGQHGYLWWWAWLNHEVRTLFSIQDANGPFRPVFLQASCSTYGHLLALNPGASLVLAPAIKAACNL
jgi:phospholipid/cholesterol/gamma-HCH transport system substrate-binding protein